MSEEKIYIHTHIYIYTQNIKEIGDIVSVNLDFLILLLYILVRGSKKFINVEGYPGDKA